MNRTDAEALALDLAVEGVVGASELLAAGLPQFLINKLLPGWQVAVDGWYVIDGRPVDAVVMARIAERIGGPGTVVSGWLAAMLHDLPWIPALPVLLALIPEDRRRRPRKGLAFRRCKAFLKVGTFAHQGISFADEPWAVIDTARQISERQDRSDAMKLRDVRGVVLGAVGAKRVTPDQLSQVLGMTAVAHSALARRAILDAERGAVSPPEAELVDDLLGCGIPFVANVEVWVHGVFLGVVDVWLLGTGVGLEQDSKQEHGNPERLDKTLLRSSGFRRAGALLCHTTPTRYRESPQAFLASVFQDVRDRQAQGLGDPAGLELRNALGPVLCGTSDGAPPYSVCEPLVRPLAA